MKDPRPAILGLLEGILGRLAGPEAAEAILGDLYEDLGEGTRPIARHRVYNPPR